ncbi:hypothetical protein K439DRAFT_1628795 [Ramaria rubella]|nr:hypothetical protein K439DRAFT_1628795 [Ramaria rubella]
MAQSETSTSSTATPIFELLEGRIPEYVSSFEGTGQYTQGGTSTCGLAALNAVKVVLGREKVGITGVRLLEEMIRKDMLDEIVAICARWASQLHLEVDDIASLPLFDYTLALSHSDYNEAEAKNFTASLNRLKESSQDKKRSAAIVLTRPPEIFAVFYILTNNPKRPGIFAVFDSHPRPVKHAKGASFILFSTLEGASHYISGLLQIDRSLLSGSLQWQAQLLGHYSGHVYFARSSYDADDGHIKSLYDANMEILELRSRLAHAKEEILEINSKLQGRIARDRGVATAERAPVTEYSSSRPRSANSLIPPIPVAGPSTSRKGKVPQLAAVQPLSSVSNDSRHQISCATRDERLETTFVNGLLHELTLVQASWEAARRMQNELDREDSELCSQIAHLKQAAQVLFTCGICFETYPEDSVARVDGCEHELCRQCMTSFVISKLEDHRYPILCPICHAQSNQRDPGVITGDIIEQIGLTRAQHAIWTGLELSQFSILLDCPKCRQSTFVDLKDHTDMKLLMCPLPKCRHVWCKECQQHVQPGALHSCDGTLELDGLMKS